MPAALRPPAHQGCARCVTAKTKNLACTDCRFDSGGSHMTDMSRVARDIADVLFEHRVLLDNHNQPLFCCSCGNWDGNSGQDWHEHVAWAIIEADPYVQ